MAERIYFNEADEYGVMDIFGRIPPKYDVSGMLFPVLCHCGQVYDMGAVTVTARYSDCSQWKTPCCNITADSRTWKSSPDYVELTPQGYVKTRR